MSAPRTIVERFYASVRRRAGTLVELTDATLTTDSVPSVAHLRLTAVHRRGRDCLYATPSK